MYKLLFICLLLLQSIFIYAQPALIPYLKGDKWGFCDAKKKLVIPAEYDVVEDFKEGFAVVIKEGQQAFIDPSGKILGSMWYEWVRSFSEGLAAVKTDEGYGYIDTKGNLVIPGQFEYAEQFSQGRAIVGKYGAFYVIDKKGTKLSETYEFIGNYTNDFATCKAGTGWTWLDLQGQILETEDNFYEVADFADNGLAAVKCDGDMKVGFVNKQGKLVIPCQYENAWLPYFSEGLAPVSKDERYGFINEEGKVVIDFQFSYAVFFSEGLSCVYQNGKCGFIDKTGKVVIPIQYKASIEGDFNFYFKNGLAAIFDPEKGKLGFIDKKGKVAIPFKYNYSGVYVYFREDGLALVSTPEDYMIAAFIDKKGKQYWGSIKKTAKE